MMTLENLIKLIVLKQELCKHYFGFNDNDFYTKEDLKRKYHELAKKYHTDITNGATDDMKLINEAYSWLKSFAKDPKDKKYIFYNENLKTLKYDFERLFRSIREPYCREHYSKTSERLCENRQKIIKQTKPIYESLKDKFVKIDIYLRNNPESSVSKYIQNIVYELVHANKIESRWNGYEYYSNINLAAKKFYSSMMDYRDEFVYQTGQSKGIGRNDMRKCRNQALVELINFTKEMQSFLLMINNGFVEVPEDYNNEKGIINLTYIADYKVLNNCFYSIRKSGNYFCYISDEEKKILLKKKYK